jgi:hypothetical protein
MADDDKPKAGDMDERVAIPLDPEEALKGLLKVDPEDEPVPVEKDGEPPAGDPLAD